MDEREALEYLELLDEALELLGEKRECMAKVLQSRTGAKERNYLDRVKEIDILLEENRGYLEGFSHLKK